MVEWLLPVGRLPTIANHAALLGQARAAPGDARQADAEDARVRAGARPRHRDVFIASRWEKAPGKSRAHKYYRLTAAGRRQLTRQASRWEELVAAIGRVMRPAEG